MPLSEFPTSSEAADDSSPPSPPPQPLQPPQPPQPPQQRQPKPLPKKNHNSSLTPLPEDDTTSRQNSKPDLPPSSLSRRPSSLQQLQALGLFRSDDDDKDLSAASSLRLETDHYVRQMRERRGRVILGKIDGRLRRRLGYEIERRLLAARRMSTRHKKRHRNEENPFHRIVWGNDNATRAKLQQRQQQQHQQRLRLQWRQRPRRSRRLYHRHHRFCIRCVTSSFAALFNMILLRRSGNGELNDDDGPNSSSRTPSPKMLLSRDGRLHWPVFPIGGPAGSGALISATTSRFAVNPDRTAAAEDTYSRQPGRENFSLGSKDSTSAAPAAVAVAPLSSHVDESTRSLDETRLLGWLQVRDSKGGRQRRYLPVMDPAPAGPFRKAPWHGNMHVLKF